MPVRRVHVAAGRHQGGAPQPAARAAAGRAGGHLRHGQPQLAVRQQRVQALHQQMLGRGT